MIRLCLALLLACLSLAPPAAADARGGMVRVKPVQIAIREGPGTKFPTVGTVYKDDELPVLESRGNWLLVSVRRDGARVEGWLNAAFAEEIDRGSGRPGSGWNGDKDRWTAPEDSRPRPGQGGWDGNGGHWTGGGRAQQGGQGSGRPSWEPQVTAAARSLSCRSDRNAARCEAELEVHAELPRGDASGRSRSVRVSCRALLEYSEEEGGRAGSTQADASADLPAERGKARGMVAMRFDLPFLRSPLRSAQVADIDCRAR
ncbi:SH3 domain-containing protein [Mangrovicoccus sp. HB161399]|uniref:SH3 domain-containing protein n=1 Tax=Mangrovicoccus sp. HB161399 TaxID=2720392 RepID=UPI00155468A1|nr:SH3 domain-containing protein [Mangrovicoccus sp. HB161399]